MTPPIVSPVFRIKSAVLEAWAVWAGIESGLFEALQSPARLEDLCARLDFDPLAFSALVRALLTTGYLEEGRGGEITVSWASRPFVLKSSPQFIGCSLSFLQTAHLFEAYPRLLREGGGLSLSERDWALMAQRSPLCPAVLVDEMMKLVPDLARPGTRLLEVGCGRGDVSLALAVRNPTLGIMAIDSNPALVDLAVERVGVSELVQVRRSEVHDIHEKFDVVLVNQLLYGLGSEKSQAVVSACAERLKSGGVLLISEPVENGQNHAAMEGLMVRLFFAQGEMLRREQILGLAANANLRARAVRIDAASPEVLLVVATN